jgi:hypothetical protein
MMVAWPMLMIDVPHLMVTSRKRRRMRMRARVMNICGFNCGNIVYPIRGGIPNAVGETTANVVKVASEVTPKTNASTLVLHRKATKVKQKALKVEHAQLQQEKDVIHVEADLES